ncbi:MAG: F0F1 ATP synthase subunit B [Alphaproteobacteria bacterium]|nr:F0F1 ATP synthase subunit B [Alphaproteobacteria bacterium]
MNEEIISETDGGATAISTGQEIIDATQNIIMDAAENVSEVISVGKNVATEIHEVPFYAEVEFWVAMAFVLAVLLLLKPLSKVIRSSLHNRINKVLQDIDDASKLRDDAQILLANYERKFVDAQKEAEQIVQKSKISLENLKKRELANLKNELKDKEKEAERRILASTQKAQGEINLSASKVSVELAQKTINRYLQNTDKSKLIDNAIADLDKFVS